jgi:hypothetical protein
LGYPFINKQKKLDFYFNYTDPENSKVAAILAQMKLMSNKRLVRNIYTMRKDYFNQIKNKIKKML